MKKIKEYKIVKESTVEILERRIEEKLNSGWNVFGDPFFHPDNNICQAIVKYENEKQIL